MNPIRGTEPKTILKLQAGFMRRSSYYLAYGHFVVISQQFLGLACSKEDRTRTCTSHLQISHQEGSTALYVSVGDLIFFNITFFLKLLNVVGPPLFSVYTCKCTFALLYTGVLFMV